jgi:16S rRNA (cytosine1402-N4)-methyltransferase
MPAFVHKPVMLAEVMTALKPHPGGRYADGTLGGAGHAEAILEASGPDGWLYGCDRDGVAIEVARRRLDRFLGRCEIRRCNFARMAEWIPAGSCDGVLMDLGVSSPQLDVAERGFSFQQDGPLDMRMDAQQQMTAADLVNTATPEELARLFREYGGEHGAWRIACEIARQRQSAPFETTLQLAGLVERLQPRRGSRIHPATRIFQALRIAVNDELGSLREGLDAALKVLKPGGCLAVITFHSLEDRMVKDFGKVQTRDYTFDGVQDVPELRRPCPPRMRWVSRKAILPSDAETAENARSRSAQLRLLEKV